MQNSESTWKEDLVMEMNMGMASGFPIQFVFHKVVTWTWLDAINFRLQIPVTTLDFQVNVGAEEAQYVTKELCCHASVVCMQQHCLQVAKLRSYIIS